MPSTEKLLVFDADTATEDWSRHFASVDTGTHTVRFGDSVVLVATGSGADLPAPAGLPVPRHTLCPSGNLRLGARELRPQGTVVSLGQVGIGDGTVAVFAGPCAVENREQLFATAEAAARCGAAGLRGGAFKPRTSPYSFQGLRWEGLGLLAEARERTGLPVLTECVDPRHVERLAAVVDGFQIGARNMQNFELLVEVGRSGRPVVLKRGFGCTVDELLAASEYLTAQGNDQVVLCERGIRTHEQATRFTLDLAAVALLKRRTHLPVMVDPSHSAGIPALVEPLSLAAVAAGADALLIDVHVDPERARCDGQQALLPEAFERLMGRLELLALSLGRKLSDTPARRQLRTLL